jgi:hypothetical protein
VVVPVSCRQVEKLELEPHLNTCFRHFMLFTLVGGQVGVKCGQSAAGGVACIPTWGLMRLLGEGKVSGGSTPIVACRPSALPVLVSRLALRLCHGRPRELAVAFRATSGPSPSSFPSPLLLPRALQEFNLIDERELAPLKELIDRMVR